MSSKQALQLLATLLLFASIYFIFSNLGCSNRTKETQKLQSGSNFALDTEIKLGEFYDTYLFESDPRFKKLENTSTDSVIQVLTERLLQNISEPKFNYQFYIVNNSETNAITIPGGRIYIYKGLIDYCESPEELTAILAHEIGHAELRHVFYKISTELGLTLLFTILTGGDPQLIAQTSKLLLSNVFSRQQEAEADIFAAHLLTASNIHPHALNDFFKRLAADESDYPEQLELFSTHPATDERVHAIDSFPVAAEFTEIPFTLNWATFQEQVSQL